MQISKIFNLFCFHIPYKKGLLHRFLPGILSVFKYNIAQNRIVSIVDISNFVKSDKDSLFQG